MAKEALFNGWENVVATGRNELVFANRNKAYGAYIIRREYNKTLSLVVLGLIGGLVLTFATVAIINKITGSMDDYTPPPVDITQIDLTPPPIDETQPPPPPPPPPPPVMETVKFVPPVVTDEEVKEEEVPPPQEKLNETTVANTTQEGTGGDEIVVPNEGNGNGVIEERAPEIFTIVEEMPEPPGGIQEFYKYVGKSVQYPQMAKEAGIGGKCFLKFVVNEGGDISDVTILKGVPGCPECDKEAQRVVKNSAKWKAGKQNGRAVKVWYNFFVNFTLK